MYKILNIYTVFGFLVVASILKDYLKRRPGAITNLARLYLNFLCFVIPAMWIGKLICLFFENFK